MIESAARAERFELSSSASPFYLWEVPQKPIAVKLPFPLIDRLENEAVENFKSLSSRGSEIGGVLLGKVLASAPPTVLIDDYELITCDYSRGPLYRLSEADTDRFERAIAQHASSGLAVVGFFRSHTRKALSLDPEDLVLLDSRFKAAHHVALLIRPFASKPSTGAIFIREDGKINPEASYLEFVFHSAQLTPSTKKIEEKVEAEPSAAPSSPASKTPARAQIVPISRREVPPPPAPPAAPPAVKPEPQPAPAASAPAEPPAEAVAPAPPAPAPAVEPPPAPKAKIEEPVKAEPPAREPEAEQAAPAGSSGKLVKIVVGLAAALILGVVLFVYPGVLVHHKAPQTATSSSPQDSSALALRVQHNGGELLLTWNRDSDVVRNATGAVLSISDGDRQENAQVDLGTLHTGSIVYAPASADVTFKMEVTGRDNAKTASESVRILNPRPSPMPPVGQQGAQAQTGSNKPAAQTTAAAPATGTPAAETTPQEQVPAKAPLKTFRAETLAQRLHAAPATESLPDAPTMGAVQRPSSALSGLNLGTSAPPPVAAPKPAAPAASNPSARPQTGGNIVQAQLLRKKDPEYPKIARDAGARGTVELLATIGADGRVKSVQVLSGHPMLRKPASDAVMQWVYKPTLLNGVPVEAPVQVSVNFMGR
jgi:protein TonB